MKVAMSISSSYCQNARQLHHAHDTLLRAVPSRFNVNIKCIKMYFRTKDNFTLHIPTSISTDYLYWNQPFCTPACLTEQ